MKSLGRGEKRVHEQVSTEKRGVVQGWKMAQPSFWVHRFTGTVRGLLRRGVVETASIRERKKRGKDTGYARCDRQGGEAGVREL